VRLLLDEDSGARLLRDALHGAGHNVERVVDVPALGLGASDNAVFNYAVANDRLLITKNGADFIAIATQPGALQHPGVLVIHYAADGSGLPVATVVRAVANIAQTYPTTKSMFLDVNHHVW
jgi:predicted nuclease of predicted toxin-antitoxin system